MDKKPEISQKTENKIEQLDKKLKLRKEQPMDLVSKLVEHLLTFGKIEVGYRSSCGKTDPTTYTWRAWTEILPYLKRDGFKIQQERVKHKNSWATVSGGFWDSSIFTLVQ